MKLSELNVGTDYAVVPSWTYNNQSARDVSKVRENDVVRATLLSKDKYSYEASNRKADPNNFTKAPAGDRSVGVLVEATDNNGQKIYWTSRLADIVAPYSQLEPKWNAQKQAEADREREANKVREQIHAHKQKVLAEVERSRNSISLTAKELLGEKTFVSVDTTGYDLDYRAVVNLSLDEFQQLVEMAYQGKEVYA